MIKITVAKSSGFCFGVNRAVNILYEMVEIVVAVKSSLVRI